MIILLKKILKKFKIGNYLTPLTIALFANSPFYENKPSGFLSYRGKVWQETNRGGIMPITFENVNFEKYIDHALNYPILFLKKRRSTTLQMVKLLKIF